MLTRLDLRGVPEAELAGRVPRPGALDAGPVEAVGAIVADVRREGDAALRRYTEQLDGVVLDDLRVPADALHRALDVLDGDLRSALDAARDAIDGFHRTQLRPDHTHESGGITIRAVHVPVDRAGLYVPGGRGAYPSTVLMTAVPARVAGVGELVLCVPADRTTGQIAPVTLAAAAIAGVDEVYAVGGAQAIAVMAYGTQSIRPVDVIAGPGNIYVALAKRAVADVVGIPSAFAGPSEIVVIADDSTPPTWAAIDVIVQAEHGPDGLAWLITWSPEAADAIDAEIERLVAAAPRRADIERNFSQRGHLALVDGPDAAVAVANLVAPEHLQIMSQDPEALVPLVRHAGAVFCGALVPASIGDYLAGPSHVLPTYGSARYASVLTVDDFQKQVHVIDVDREGFDRVASHVQVLAEAEGFDAHAESIRSRRDGVVIEPRDDVALRAGYHSPQVDVKVRLNTNEAPEPPPLAWREAYTAALATIDWHRYPDRDATAVRAVLAAYHGVDPAQVFVANGSNEVLQTVLLTYGGAGRTAAVWQPTYALHAHISLVTGTQVVEGERAADFRTDLAEVERVVRDARPSVMFLCTPNNPTGVVDDEETVRSVLATAVDADALLVVDEAYGQFAPWSALGLVDDDLPLVVTRTFSKTWSMAAARLGYLIGPRAVVAHLEQVVLPYHLDAAKQVAATLALDFTDEMEARVARLVEERGRLAAGLAELAVDVWPSGANFILFRPTGVDGPTVWQRLLERSILVRDVSSMPRVEGCLRVTVGTPDENDLFLDALSEILR